MLATATLDAKPIDATTAKAAVTTLQSPMLGQIGGRPAGCDYPNGGSAPRFRKIRISGQGSYAEPVVRPLHALGAIATTALAGQRGALGADAARETAILGGVNREQYGQRIVERVAPTVFIGGVLLALLVSQGGFFATSWGWSTLSLLLAAAVLLVVRDSVALGRLELYFVALLAGLTAWTAGSAGWSGTTGTSLLEAQRTLLFATVAFAVALAARTLDVSRYLLVVLGVVTTVAAYALYTRCWPARFTLISGLAGYRLARPIGYWNGLGIVVAAGACLAVGLAAGSGPRWVRSFAAAACVPLVLTLYFTFSRAAWIGLAFGIAVTLVAARARLHFVGWMLATALAPGLGVAGATRLHALSTLHASASAAAHDGIRLAMLTALFSGLAVAVSFAGYACERRVHLSSRTRRAVGSVLAGVVAAAAVAGVVAVGRSPAAIVSTAYHDFVAPRPTVRGNLDQRLFSFSGNGRIELWRTAWHDYRTHPWLGSGAGTFERAWDGSPNADFEVQDAHGLYIETLAELGPLGLVVLTAALFGPLVLTLRRRARPAVAGAAGAYAAYLIHAGVDWDWELAGVTAVAIALATLLLVERRRQSIAFPGSARIAAVAGAVVLSIVSAGAYAGNSAVAAARSDLGRSRFAKAMDDASRARRLMPWSPQPLVLLAEADLGESAFADARAELQEALKLDDADWQTWLDLALASRGVARERALAQATRLFPTSPEIAAVRRRGNRIP